MVSAASDVENLAGRFRIEAELARGGMGTVYRATDSASGQRVALKRLSPSAPAQVARLFEREFYVLSSLKHPRIIDVYDYGVDAEGPYYTMELLDGSDLREVSPVEPKQACRYLRDVASSLALLHARKLLHRDVSPRNVRTLPDGGCKLIDFGALASFGTAEDLVGTPPAIPPEAVSGQPLDQRSDLFSFGTLAYYILTGRHAYPARRVSELSQVWAEKPAPPSEFAEDISPELDQLVLSLISLDPLGRPSSAADVIERLSVLGGLGQEKEEQAAQAYLVGAVLVDREQELGRVRRRLRRASGGRGNTVFVDSEPGAGKSRFLEEVALKAQLSGVTVLRTDGKTQSGAFSTARALLVRLSRVVPGLVRSLIQPDVQVIEMIWPELVSELELDGGAGGEHQTGIAPSRSHAAALLPAILERCFVAVARKNSLVIAVDNIESVDAESAALLLTLSRAARTERLLVVVTARLEGAELPAAVRAIRDGATGIRLRNLTEEGVTALVRNAFGDVPHVRRTATRLFGATGGNPAHSLGLMQRWVTDGIVDYAAGGWTLPIELPAEALPPRESFAMDRLTRCSPEAREVATTLAVLGTPATLALWVALEASKRGSRDMIAIVEELWKAEVLSLGSDGYRFADDALAAAFLGGMTEPERRETHARVGEVLLTFDPDRPRRFEAAGHLVRGTDPTRGAHLVVAVARETLLTSVDPGPAFAKASRALEGALEIYRRDGRSNTELLSLLVPLVIAAYDVSSTYADPYADETIERLNRALGLTHLERQGLDAGRLVSILGAAPVLDEGEQRTAETPDVTTLVGWLVRSVLLLTNIGATRIDREFEARYTAALEPFTVLGENHPAAAAYHYCRLVMSMAEDRFSESHRGWAEYLPRIEKLGFPAPVLLKLRQGALYSLSMLEAQWDGDAALARIQEIENLNTPQSRAVTDQIRFLYCLFRGDVALAERYRERVESYAVQYGSAWQVEIWSTTTLVGVALNLRDVAMNKRAVEQLERLKATLPSLERFWEYGAAGQACLTGAPARAVELCERALARSEPQDLVGWRCARGVLARAHNMLGHYEVAKQVCEETLAISAKDEDYVALNLNVHLELAVARAALGDAPTAISELDLLLERHAANKNPMTLGAIHRTHAVIAHAAGDTAGFEQHLQRMEHWFHPTENAALRAQCDEVRHLGSRRHGWKEARGGAKNLTVVTTAQSMAQSVLATCKGADERKQRALEVVAAQAGSAEGWLVTRDGDGDAVMACALGTAPSPSQLLVEVQSLFDAEDDDDGDDTVDTAFVPNSPESALEPVVVPKQRDYQLFPLIVARGRDRVLVGAIAVTSGVLQKPVSASFVQEIANQLFQAGDLATIRRSSNPPG